MSEEETLVQLALGTIGPADRCDLAHSRTISDSVLQVLAQDHNFIVQMVAQENLNTRVPK